MIDPNAFAEWIVAKAKKSGAFTSAENLRVARDAVEVALARDADEIHVLCVLAGSRGTVAIDERMTRMAVGVLFPKVLEHPTPLFELRPEPPPPPPPEPIDYERIERERRKRVMRRRVIFIVGAILVATCVSGITVLIETEREAPSSGKHEMRH